MGRKFFAIAAIVQGIFTFLCGAIWAGVNALLPSGEVFDWILYEGDELLEYVLLFCIPNAIVCLGVSILIPANEKRP